MADFDFTVTCGNQFLVPEFEPFQKKDLVTYLKSYTLRWEQLQQRQQRIMEQMRELEKTRKVSGQGVNERMESYAYGKHGDDGIGSSVNRYNPDTLFNRWFKIYYEPFETQKKIYTNSLTRILYEQWQMETVHWCVELLPIEYRHLILSVYIERQKVASYCELFQLGHDRYNKMKEQALNLLLDQCNSSLLTLKSNWEDMHAKSFMDPECDSSERRTGLSMAGL